jgi:hypothetical protein
MTEIAAKWPSTAAKIRALDAAGFNRQEIATFLGKSYQHVYNTLSYPLAGQRGQDEPPARAGGLAEEAAAPPFEPAAATEAASTESDIPRVHRFFVEADGRIVLPPEALHGLDAAPGRLVTARFEDGELRLMSIEAAVRFVQTLAAPYIKEGEGNWSDEVIAERRAEADREAEHDNQ